MEEALSPFYGQGVRKRRHLLTSFGTLGGSSQLARMFTWTHGCTARIMEVEGQVHFKQILRSSTCYRQNSKVPTGS